MRPALALAALVVGLVLTGAWPVAPASASVSVTIRTPLNGVPSGNTLKVAATVVSTFGLASVTAQVEDRQASLTFSSCAYESGGCWPGLAGSLSLVGLSHGAHVLTVTATDVFGTSAQEQRTVTFDLPPSVSVVLPLQGTVARPDVDLDASCSDDDSCFLTVTAISLRRTVVASGVGTVQVRLSLAANEGHSVLLNFAAVDSAGQRVVVQRHIVVESSPRYVEVETVNGLIVDADADRVLAVESNDSDSVLTILDRATRDEESVPTIAEREPRYGFLAPRGAIFVAGGIAPPAVYEWRDGSLIQLEGVPYGARALTAAGPFAMWIGSPAPGCCVWNAYRHDLINGITVNLGTAGNIGNRGVGPNGDVVFWNPYQIYRYRDGTTTQLTHDATLWNVDPVTDGVNVVYRKQTPCCHDQTYAIAMFGAAGEVILAQPGPDKPVLERDYLAAGGWVAYTKSGLAGERQVWRRAPDGTESQLSYFGTSSPLFGLSPTGEVLFTNDRLYLSRPGSEPLPVGSRVASFSGYPLWIDGEWHVVLGRSLFRIDADNATPDAPGVLAQLRTDRSTTIPVGGTTVETSVVLRATVNDADAGQTVKLQVVVHPLDTTSTSSLTAESPLVASGSTVYVTVGALDDGRYRWWARTVDHLGVASAWVPFGGNGDSEVDFVIDIVPPAPTLVSPTGTITDRTPTYTWTPVPRATSYVLQVDDRVTAKKIYRTYTPEFLRCGETCSVTPATLLSVGAGTWRVVARNGLNTASPPSVSAFTVVTTPPLKAPTLIAPTGAVPDTTPTYTWNAVLEATSYVLQVDDAVTERKILVSYSPTEAGCPTGTGRCAVTPTTALAAGAAGWRVQARNPLGKGPWPSMVTFTVFVGPPLSAPTLLVPTGTVADTTPTYKWNAVEGAASYIFQVNDALTVKKVYRTYTAAEAGCATGTGRCSVTPPTALTEGPARWRVRARNSFGKGPWPANSRTFTVDAP